MPCAAAKRRLRSPAHERAAFQRLRVRARRAGIMIVDGFMWHGDRW
jgi:hypothetical protein